MAEPVAKWNDQNDKHLLIYHLIDSGIVAKHLWDVAFTEATRADFIRWLALPEKEVKQVLAFWSALHDIGKATPAFQLKYSPGKEELHAEGYSFPNYALGETQHHSLLSAWIIEDWEGEMGIAPHPAFMNYLFAIGGHHGSYPNPGNFLDNPNRSANLGRGKWTKKRSELFEIIRSIFPAPQVSLPDLSKAEMNSFFLTFSGFVVAADWISSQDSYFSYLPELIDLDDYCALSNARALVALEKSGWKGWQPDEQQIAFDKCFPFSPNPIQIRMIEEAKLLENPGLLILEAPTGIGKTEAALVAADCLIHKGKMQGSYIAMPTQATSNQMFGRIESYLKQRYPDQEIELHLAHGNALLNIDYQELRFEAIADEESSRPSGVIAHSWFTPRKRTLLAPFGVGTVDQAFMSVLQTKHYFLRLFGLHRKVIIFDEVHAYDVYMVELFKRLLSWLRAIGSSVIILSATLPRSTRSELLAAFDQNATIGDDESGFPRISINDCKTIRTIPLDPVKNRSIRLERVEYGVSSPQELDHKEEPIVSLLKEKLNLGGCAAVICNTVDRAQAIFLALKASGVFSPTDLFLFHSRMPFYQRQKLEENILSRFGKNTESKMRNGVVVATQVIEQSLDLDFDLLVTDLAPVDLLIQRMGRLHRHSNPIRPKKLLHPVCVVSFPPLAENGLGKFTHDRWVYDEYILQRTLFALIERQNVMLPGQSDELIAQVYCTEPLESLTPEQNETLIVLYCKMLKGDETDIAAARNRLIPSAERESVLLAEQIFLEEDDPKVHKDMQAMTRITRPTVQLVCFIRSTDGSLRLADDLKPFKLETQPEGQMLRHVLRSMATSSNQEVFEHFIRHPPIEAWKTVPQLRYAYPIIFENGVYPVSEKLSIILDKELGLIYEKKTK
jgi:CRISPR-associated endonuclease/helicase Cas3